MVTGIAGEHPEQRQAAAEPQTKPIDLSRESTCRLLSSTLTIAIWYYSARKLMLIVLPTEDRRLSQPRRCS